MKNISTSFKDTEVGFIPQEWDVLSVKDVAEVNEKTISAKNAPETIEYLDTSSVDEGIILNFQTLNLRRAPSRAKRILRSGDTVMSTVRPNLKHFAFIKDAKKNQIASTGFAVVTPTRINPRFLYFCLTTEQVTEYLTSIAASQTSTYPAINPEVIQTLLIAVPSKDEQEKIAEVLSSLDEKIALNRLINITLERIINSLFKKLFVDINNDLPKEWKIGNLGDICIQRTERVNNQFPNVKVLSAVSSGNLIRSEDYFNKQVFSKSLEKYKLVEQFDIAYNPSRINIGSIGMLEEDIKGAVSPIYTILRPKKQYHYFIQGLLQLGSVKNYINQYASGSVRQALSFEAFASIPVIIPPAHALAEFNELVLSFKKIQSEKVSENKSLLELKRFLLPRLIQGKIRI